MYVSQRRNDSRVLGHHGGTAWPRLPPRTGVGFLQFDLGVSDAAVAVAARRHSFQLPRDRRRRVHLQINNRLQAIATLEVIHISNAGIAGSDRNPDIEAIGPSLGLLIGF